MSTIYTGPKINGINERLAYIILGQVVSKTFHLSSREHIGSYDFFFCYIQTRVQTGTIWAYMYTKRNTGEELRHERGRLTL